MCARGLLLPAPRLAYTGSTSHRNNARLKPGDTRNIGALLWVNDSGAMIAAIPTAPWDEYGTFRFYRANPGATTAFELMGWSDDQEGWDGGKPEYVIHQQRAEAYFNAAMGA